MKLLLIGVSMILGAGPASAQDLRPSDIVAIERAAAEHVAGSLPQGDIGVDPDIIRGKQRISRDSARVRMLARVLRARVVRTDSVFGCPRGPATCTLGVAALVRVGEPVATNDGARVSVEVRRRSAGGRQPVVVGADELVVRKQDGVWKVVGVAARRAS